MSRVVSRRKIEMVWRCSSCGHQNRGRDKECTHCGNPKDASEHFEMPSSTAAAPSVTDPALLRLAEAGPDWRCSYCGSDQRRLNNTCALCGAAIEQGTSTAQPGASGTDADGGAVSGLGAAARPGAAGGAAAARLNAMDMEGDDTLDPLAWGRGLRRKRLRLALKVLAGLVVAGTTLFCGLGWWWTRPFDAVVQSSRWEHEVVVERYQVMGHEGFSEAQPAGAFDVTPLGQRHHHDEQVLDHYRTEHYTEQVACGEDCYSVAESCSEHCSSDSNGFATCETVCSGGGERCTTRYCSESRQREVPVYRSEPRYATWYSWRVWEWVQARTLHREGAGPATVWPTDAEVALNTNVGAGERERATRVGRYSVTLHNEDGEVFELRPEQESEFTTYSAGRTLRVRSTLEGNQVELAPVD